MMKTTWRRSVSVIPVAIFTLLTLMIFDAAPGVQRTVSAQAAVTPTPAPVFDQRGALAKLREQIKGKEQEPAAAVFKNIRMLKQMPAGRLLAVMEMGYARSLGVNCTHCHVPDKWESDDKTQKQTARDMWAMMNRINTELLKNIKDLKGVSPAVNCTTCHRGQVTPALDLPMPPKV